MLSNHTFIQEKKKRFDIDISTEYSRQRVDIYDPEMLQGNGMVQYLAFDRQLIKS